MKTKNLTLIKSGICKIFWYLFILQALYIIYSIAPQKCDPIITLNEDFVYLSGPNIVREGEKSSTYKISIKEEFSNDLNISLSYSGTALENFDYTPIENVTIKKGELFAEFSIQTLDDPYAEYNEQFAIKITSINGKSFLNSFNISNPDNVIYTKILDEKNPKHTDKDTNTITLHGASTLHEDKQKGIYSVKLSQIAQEDIDLNISYEGSAEYGVDYKAPKTLQIKKGKKSADFTILVIDDIYKEANEDIHVSISDFNDIGFEDIRFDTDKFNIKIKDESTPTEVFSLTLDTQRKASETQTIKYTLKSTKVLLDDITCIFSIESSDSNTYNEDVQITIKKGMKEASFELRVKDDNLIEKKQHIQLHLKSIQNTAYEKVQLNTSNIKTKIYDNKDISNQSASMSLEAQTQVYEGSKSLRVNIKSSQKLQKDLKYTLKYTGTATNKKDFIAPKNVVIKKATDTSTFTIKILNDNSIEDEKIIIHAKTRGKGGLESIDKVKPLSIELLDERNPSSKRAAIVSLKGTRQVAEGKKALYTIELSQALEDDLKVHLSFAEKKAKEDEDFIALKTFTMKKGLKKATFYIETVDNAIAENIESFQVQLDSMQGGGLESILIDKTKRSIETSITDEIDIVNEFKKVVEKQKILFEYAKDSLDSKSFTALDSIAALLVKFPKALLTVEGHTDTTGNKYRNKKLSKRRANSVMKYLLEKGIAAKRLKSIGYGQERPMVPDSYPNANKLNKRVEFKVSYKENR